MCKLGSDCDEKSCDNCKNKRHKHADMIKALADGAEIEYQAISGNWYFASSPCWNNDTTYRVKPETDPYAELKAAFFDGEDIQIFNGRVWKDWDRVNQPWWNLPINRYRIKPDPKPDVVQYFRATQTPGVISPQTAYEKGYWSWCSFGRSKQDNVKVVFDGESGELKSVEKI